MSVINYLLDEHVDPRLRKAIKRLAPDAVVWCIGDIGAPALSTLDPDILIWCEENAFSLVTNNRASMPTHLQDHFHAGRRVPGIFVLNPRFSFGETAEELVLIWAVSEAEEYYDQIWFLPISH